MRLKVAGIILLLPIVALAQRSDFDSQWSKEFAVELNNIRKRNGLAELEYCTSLSRQSYSYSKSMSRRFKGKPRLQHAASRFLWIKKYDGEVIAFNSSEHDPQSILNQWMSSPPHRRILLDRTSSRIGASGSKGYFVARVKK